MHINLFFTLSTPKMGRVWAFSWFLGDLWESIQFTEDSEDKLNYTPAQSSRYSLVFCTLPFCFRNSGQVQPRIASLDLGMSTFLQLRVLGICQRGWICSGTGATLLPAPGACCLTWILPLQFGAEKRVRNLGIGNSWDGTGRWARGKVITLHGSLEGRKQRVNVQQQCWKKAGIWAVLALTCWDLRLGSKV